MMVMREKDWEELMQYRQTGLSPEDVMKLKTNYDDDFAPRPLIMKHIPTPEQFWSEA